MLWLEEGAQGFMDQEGVEWEGVRTKTKQEKKLFKKWDVAMNLFRICFRDRSIEINIKVNYIKRKKWKKDKEMHCKKEMHFW